MIDVETAVETYIAAYNEPDAVHKKELLERSFRETGRYSSEAVVLDRDEVFAMASDFHETYFMTITSDIRVVQRYVTFDWLIVDSDGETVMSGVDFRVASPDGRLQEVVVFKD